MKFPFSECQMCRLNQLADAVTEPIFEELWTELQCFDSWLSNASVASWFEKTWMPEKKVGCDNEWQLTGDSVLLLLFCYDCLYVC